MKRISVVKVLLAVAAAAPLGGARSQDVLPPEQAYPYSIEASSDQVLVRFAVLDGYYLYRERFGFESGTAAVGLRPAQFPRGEIHSDEFFGEQEIYRGDFDIAIPYTRNAAADQLELELRLQGCADIGLCYPPQRWTAEIDLPAGPVASSQNAGGLITPFAQNDRQTPGKYTQKARNHL